MKLPSPSRQRPAEKREEKTTSALKVKKPTELAPLKVEINKTAEKEKEKKSSKGLKSSSLSSGKDATDELPTIPKAKKVIPKVPLDLQPYHTEVLEGVSKHPLLFIVLGPPSEEPSEKIEEKREEGKKKAKNASSSSNESARIVLKIYDTMRSEEVLLHVNVREYTLFLEEFAAQTSATAKKVFSPGDISWWIKHGKKVVQIQEKSTGGVKASLSKKNLTDVLQSLMIEWGKRKKEEENETKDSRETKERAPSRGKSAAGRESLGNEEKKDIQARKSTPSDQSEGSRSQGTSDAAASVMGREKSQGKDMASAIQRTPSHEISKARSKSEDREEGKRRPNEKPLSAPSENKVKKAPSKDLTPQIDDRKEVGNPPLETKVESSVASVESKKEVLQPRHPEKEGHNAVEVHASFVSSEGKENLGDYLFDDMNEPPSLLEASNKSDVAFDQFFENVDRAMLERRASRSGDADDRQRRKDNKEERESHETSSPVQQGEMSLYSTSQTERYNEGFESLSERTSLQLHEQKGAEETENEQQRKGGGEEGEAQNISSVDEYQSESFVNSLEHVKSSYEDDFDATSSIPQPANEAFPANVRRSKNQEDDLREEEWNAKRGGGGGGSYEEEFYEDLEEEIY